MRIACFIVPLFPLAARLRSEPELVSEAVAVVEGSGSAARIVAATRRARKERIRPGMTLPQARALMPKLIARSRDAECERAAQEALLEVAEMFSPRVEDAGEGVVYLDITGTCYVPRGTTHETRSSERAYALAAIRAVEGIGMPVRVGIAGSKLAAHIAAELPKSPNVIPPGEEASFIAPLPLERLSPEMQAAVTLGRWGIESIGDLARLPEAEVASRLGELGRDLHWAARGIDPRPIIPRVPPPEFREGMDFEWALVALEPFLFVANAALDRLVTRLESQGFSCSRIEFELRLEPDGFHSRAVDLPAPTRDVKTLLTLMRLDLEAQPPGAPVIGFTIAAHPDKPRRAQLSLFGPAALAPDKLATAIARLGAMLGNDRVGMPRTVDGFAPERFAIAMYDPPPPPKIRRKPRRGRGLLAVRVLRPPLPLEVDADGDQIRSIRTLPNDQKSLEINGPVRVSSGPWRMEEGWWEGAPVEREYWDVEVAGNCVCRIFRYSASWYVDGLYD